MKVENELQQILDKYGINAHVDQLMRMWDDGTRHYHSTTHLEDLVRMIREDKAHGSVKTDTEYDQLMLAALFHDVVYRPGRGDNEELSAAFFLKSCSNPDDPVLLEVHQAILDTKSHISNSQLSAKFNRYDMNIVERGYDELLAWERGIYEEYKGAGKHAYKLGRLAFLKSLLEQYPHNRENLERLTQYVENGY
ncbi:MAG: adenylyltransferase/cytidyltransferase family protein [Flavipsychrobacter sp.]|jgi:predicted metal-dependent HD superfamily phosphohydrolase|nr:adenylyltransferase/cytidyltransferase family protein [Flavipsychrobacter sp.]